MSINWKEIDLILNELNLPGMQIQKIYQSTFDILAMIIYGKTTTNGNQGGSHLLIASLLPRACRFHESFCAVPKSKKPLRFAELLKSRLLNGRIEEAVQLGEDRIIRIIIRRGEYSYRLYIRLWSNAGNVILTDDDGIILDAMKRRPKSGEIGGKIYRPENMMAARVQAQTKIKDYEIRDLPGEGSFNKRIDSWYAEHGASLSLEQLREEVQRRMKKNRSRLEASLDRLREKELDYANGDRYKEYGDLILSNTGSLPKGESWLETRVPSETDGEIGTIRIELDPRKNAAENAANYYGKYRKAKSGLAELQEEIRAGELELNKLSETEKQLLAENNPFHLELLIKKLQIRSHKVQAEKSAKRPGVSFTDGDWLILAGRDAKENDELLRHHVKGNDLWLHTRDWAGSYVFIKHRPGKTIPLEILLDAGNLALFYSKGRNNKRGDLYYTQVKYLRRVKNGPKGLVIPTQEKNLSITLEDKRLKKLESCRVQ